MKKTTTKKADFEGIVTPQYLEDIAQSHLEAWKDRYSQYMGNRRRVEEDIYINHDDSLEVERLEEELGRELTPEEHDLFTGLFHDTVMNVWEQGIY